MDKTELVNLVSSKAGLSQDQATQAVDTVLDFIKQKLPPELANQFDLSYLVKVAAAWEESWVRCRACLEKRNNNSL